MLTAGPLTVKHIESNGFESIVQSTHVNFIPGDTQNPTELIAFGVAQPVSDGCNRYRNGIVYVMNEAGATVAKYEID